MSNFLACNHNSFRESRADVPSSDFHFQFRLQRISGTDLDFNFFSGSFPDYQVVNTFHIFDNSLIDFIAANAPASYVVGPYTQAQQDGRMEGQVRLGEQEWNGAMLCYRDHSWGQRQMGKPDGWTIACLPGVFYLFSVEQQGRTFCLGRVFTPDAAPAKEATVVAIDGGWRISDPTSGLGEHYATRMTEPLVAYLGVSGEESIRNEPAEGDLYRDELGPATFISPRHQKFVGFIEHARRL